MSEKLSHNEVWLRAWVAVAQSSNSKFSYTAVDWADKCLAEYKKRFG